MPEYVLDPTRTAVINVDMQTLFVEGTPLSAPDGLATVARVNELNAAARAAGARVFFSRGILRADGSDDGYMTSRVPPFVRQFYAEDASTAELHPSVRVEEGDVVFTKPRYGAFSDTDLEARLRHLGIDTVLITGIATNICCDTTAREAAQRDLHVYFVADATATFEMQGVAGAVLHAATCASLAQVFADVVTVTDMVQMFASSRDLAIAAS
jgi:ureidoacrylate peracid hydrolase